MTPKSLIIVAALTAMAPVHALYAQDERTDSDKGQATTRSQDGGRDATSPAVGRAVERVAPAPRPATAAPAAAPRAAARDAEAAAPAPEDQRRRNGGRDQGDNPAVGRAVPRDSRPAPGPPPSTRDGRNDGRNDGRYRTGGVYVAPRVYNNYYYNPRRYYPYGYGAFGLGYFYYDPYTWYPPSYYPGYGYGGGYLPNSFFSGELRLSVTPRIADVYVDGYFAGRVDEFDGVFQSLKLEEGPHHVQITAPGYLPLDFDVRIDADRKITYRGVLQPYRP